MIPVKCAPVKSGTDIGGGGGGGVPPLILILYFMAAEKLLDSLLFPYGASQGWSGVCPIPRLEGFKSKPAKDGLRQKQIEQSLDRLLSLKIITHLSLHQTAFTKKFALAKPIILL